MATPKQKQVAKDIMENHGKPISKAMLDAGYTPATSKNPSNLTNSKSWQELMEQYLPDEKLAKVHEEGLEATKWNDFTGDREKDYSVRKQYLELGYKIKGKTTEKASIQNNVIIIPSEIAEKYKQNEEL